MKVTVVTAGIGLGVSLLAQAALAEQGAVGRFQAVATELPDGAPGLWILDTAFGRAALCSYQDVAESGGITSEGVTWGMSSITCSAFQLPEGGPWDKYQQE